MFSLSLSIIRNKMVTILKSKTINGSGTFAIFKAGAYTYIVPSWTKVPSNTKVEDVVVIDDGISRVVKQENVSFTKHMVHGSKGNIYEVVIDAQHGNSCTCPAFGFRRDCKHIKQILTK
jgi:hypothetical protein